jgi:hypothetical protein
MKMIFSPHPDFSGKIVNIERKNDHELVTIRRDRESEDIAYDSNLQARVITDDCIGFRHEFKLSAGQIRVTNCLH